MHSYVATRAIVKSWIGHIMTGKLFGNAASCAPRAAAIVAFETNRKGRWSFQQPRIRRAMRLMTTLAAVGSNGSVLKDKRSAFVNVALQAGLLIA